jgi:hypothetical protein
MIRKILNWLFKRQKTNNYQPLPTLDQIPTSHITTIVDDPQTDIDWQDYTADAKQPEVEVITFEAPVASVEPTQSLLEVKTETTQSVEEPKAIHKNKPKRNYHKKKNKH